MMNPTLGGMTMSSLFIPRTNMTEGIHQQPLLDAHVPERYHLLRLPLRSQQRPRPRARARVRARVRARARPSKKRKMERMAEQENKIPPPLKPKHKHKHKHTSNLSNVTSPSESLPSSSHLYLPPLSRPPPKPPTHHRPKRLSDPAASPPSAQKSVGRL